MFWGGSLPEIVHNHGGTFTYSIYTTVIQDLCFQAMCTNQVLKTHTHTHIYRVATTTIVENFVVIFLNNSDGFLCALDETLDNHITID